MRKTEEDVVASERSFVVVAHGFLFTVIKHTRSSLYCSFGENVGDAVRSVENIGQGDLEGTINTLKGNGNSANSYNSGFSFADSNG
jgi:hypothetical protein